MSNFGFTFSIKYATSFRENWKEMFLEIIHRYDWKYLRIPIYWDIVESKKGTFTFDDYLWILEQCEKKGILTTPILGLRNALFPEVHHPQWINPKNLVHYTKDCYRYIRRSLEMLSEFSCIDSIQVENEPFEYNWGTPTIPIHNLYPQTIDFVRSLTDLPIIVTYGYKPWRQTFTNPDLPEDIVGLDLYTHIRFRQLGIPIQTNLLRTPLMTNRFRRDIIFAKKHQKPIWIMELQAEPWDTSWNTPTVKEMTWEQCQKTAAPKLLRQRLQFLVDYPIERIFIWGIEWWHSWDEERRSEFYEVLP